MIISRWEDKGAETSGEFRESGEIEAGSGEFEDFAGVSGEFEESSSAFVGESGEGNI